MVRPYDIKPQRLRRGLGDNGHSNTWDQMPVIRRAVVVEWHFCITNFIMRWSTGLFSFLPYINWLMLPAFCQGGTFSGIYAPCTPMDWIHWFFAAPYSRVAFLVIKSAIGWSIHSISVLIYINWRMTPLFFQGGTFSGNCAPVSRWIECTGHLPRRWSTGTFVSTSSLCIGALVSFRSYVLSSTNLMTCLRPGTGFWMCLAQWNTRYPKICFCTRLSPRGYILVL